MMSFIVKIRDKFFPRLWLAHKVKHGMLPYTKNDLVVSNLIRGSFEKSEGEFLQRVLTDAAGIADVGANIGYYVLMASRVMNEGGQVYAFEASPIEYEKLNWTVRKNALKNVTTVHAAIGSASGTAKIFQSLSGAGALNRLDGPAKPGGAWQAVEVPMIRLDDWARERNWPAVDVMKVDVEGHELPVLIGAREWLERNRPILLIEMNDARSSTVSTPVDIFNYLIGIGYILFDLELCKSRIRLSQRTSPPTSGTVNCVALPKDFEHDPRPIYNHVAVLSRN